MPDADLSLPPVVDVAWLRAHTSDVVLADVRWYLDGRSGAAAYAGGHLPGAVFVDLDHRLSGGRSPSGARHPLPEPQAFADAMASLGIGDRTAVVAYDDAGGVIAARLVWMLRVTGHPAALLDGGITAWDGPLETEARTPAVARFTAREWPPERLASMDDAMDHANVVLDARDPERYTGEVEVVDPRGGHIPGARNLPARGNLDESGHLLPGDVLRQRFSDVGADGTARVVSYCGSGVTACLNLLALEVAGLPPGRLYVGSWSEYSSDPSRPAATGGEPGRRGQP